MDGAVAYGSGKAGAPAPFDVFEFFQRPPVVFRTLSMLFGGIVFTSIALQGWLYDEKEKRELCIFNQDSSACHYATGVSVLASLASIGFLIGEYMFEQMSSVKTRKHYVLLDLGYSSFWTLLYFIGFCYIVNQWTNTQISEDHIAFNNANAAILFIFLSIISWAGCSWYAYKRFRAGVDSAFAPSYEADPGALPGAAYTSYPGGPDSDAGYQEAPFSSTQQRGPGDYQAPAY